MEENFSINESQKTIKLIADEIFSKPPKRKYITKKTDVHSIDDVWRLDIIDLRVYGPQKNRGYRYVSIVIDKSSKFRWTLLLKNKHVQTITKKCSSKFKKKTNLTETERGEELYNSLFQIFLNKDNINPCSRNNY